MSSFPNSPRLSPRLLKGAIIGLDPVNPLASVVVFQYNPDTMTRRLDARTSGGGEGADKSEALRLTGPPKENDQGKYHSEVKTMIQKSKGVPKSKEGGHDGN